jgi:hypothetical protein
MPQNLDLTPITLPMALRFGEEPQTEFVNNLDALNVQLIDAPDPRTIRKAVYCFVKSTSKSFESSFEHAFESVINQLKKKKEKIAA